MRYRTIHLWIDHKRNDYETVVLQLLPLPLFIPPDCLLLLTGRPGLTIALKELQLRAPKAQRAPGVMTKKSYSRQAVLYIYHKVSPTITNYRPMSIF